MLQAYAHGFIAVLFLKQFGSNHVSCRFNSKLKEISSADVIGSIDMTYFMTVLHRCE